MSYTPHVYAGIDDAYVANVILNTAYFQVKLAKNVVLEAEETLQKANSALRHAETIARNAEDAASDFK